MGCTYKRLRGDGGRGEGATVAGGPRASSSAGTVRPLVEVDLVRERQVAPAARDAGQLEVDGRPLVVERGRLEYDGARAHYAGQREDPQEEPVEHHGHVLPVFDHLRGTRTVGRLKRVYRRNNDYYYEIIFIFLTTE